MSTSESDEDWGARFREVYAAPASAVLSRIFAEVLGDDYPAALDTYSWISLPELREISVALGVGPEHLLADVGCGRGGPGLWVATATGCRLVGFDIADTAVDEATTRALDLGLADRARFRTGSWEDIAQPDGSLDAVMGVDSFLFAPDKPAAFAELARVVRPGGRLALTSWDYFAQPAGRPPQVPDHRPLAAAAGFTVRSYEETHDWRERCVRAAELMMATIDDYAAEAGVTPDGLRPVLEEMRATMDVMTRRFLMIAERDSG